MTKLPPARLVTAEEREAEVARTLQRQQFFALVLCAIAAAGVLATWSR